LADIKLQYHLSQTPSPTCSSHSRSSQPSSVDSIARFFSILPLSLFNLDCTSTSAIMAEPTEQPLATMFEESSSAEEAFKSAKVSLADLCAKGTAEYAHKNYEEAADLYARASELQAELNGEMSPENAEILFLYGRALFKVGQSKSDVLGNRASGEKKKPNGGAKVKKDAPEQEIKDEVDKVVEEGVAIIAEQQNGSGAKAAEGPDAKKPLFQFTGDENFEDSDEDGEVRSLRQVWFFIDD
jgi:HAT1-interacting factor 1